MNIFHRLKDILLPLAICFAALAIAVFLTDLLLLKSVDIKIISELLVSLIGSVFLLPLFLWLHMRMEHGRIEATRLSDLELNERDIREAVGTWIFIHYNKKLEGEMEFSRNESGALNCKVTVRDES